MGLLGDFPKLSARSLIQVDPRALYRQGWDLLRKSPKKKRKLGHQCLQAPREFPKLSLIQVGLRTLYRQGWDQSCL